MPQIMEIKRARSAVKKPKKTGVPKISLRAKRAPKLEPWEKYLPIAKEYCAANRVWRVAHLDQTVQSAIAYLKDHCPRATRDPKFRLARTYFRKLLNVQLNTIREKAGDTTTQKPALDHYAALKVAAIAAGVRPEIASNYDDRVNGISLKRQPIQPENLAKEIEAIVDKPNVRFTGAIVDSTVQIVTRPITLSHDGESVAFGRFRVDLDLVRLGSSLSGDVASSFRVRALEPNECDSFTHPHLNGTHLCTGDGEPYMFNALASGFLTVFADLVVGVLETYNSNSPYQDLEAWTGGGHKCTNCGDRQHERDLTTCRHCDSSVCGSCYQCDDDGEALCDSCRATCPHCDAIGTSDNRRRTEAGTRCCSKCLEELEEQESKVDCPHCASTVDRSDLCKSEHGTDCCAECVDDLNQEEEDEEDDEEDDEEEGEADASPGLTKDGKNVFGAPPPPTQTVTVS